MSAMKQQTLHRGPSNHGALLTHGLKRRTRPPVFESCMFLVGSFSFIGPAFCISWVWTAQSLNVCSQCCFVKYRAAKTREKMRCFHIPAKKAGVSEAVLAEECSDCQIFSKNWRVWLSSTGRQVVYFHKSAWWVSWTSSLKNCAESFLSSLLKMFFVSLIMFYNTGETFIPCL